MQSHDDYYRKIRDKTKKWIDSRTGRRHKWSEFILFAPDLFHLLCKLVTDPAVPVKEKSKLVAAIAYFISPIDLIPEAIVGPAGYLDDIALAAYVLSSLLTKTDPAVLQRHWAGDGEVLDLIQRILRVADKMIGSGLWRKLIKWIK